MNALRTIKNHWKKSVFFVTVGGFGVSYANKKWKDHKLMQAYCIEAKKYGDMFLERTHRPKRVTVILNPAANKGKGKSVYEKNVAPILHLAGMEVNLIMTKYEGQAKKILGELEKSKADAIIIAGGNGTLSEAITGLLRRSDEAEISSIPWCIIPLGKTNSLAQSLYLPAIGNTVQFIAELALSSVTGPSTHIDVMHVKGNDEKSVYAVSNLSVGTFTDAEIRKKKNWYFGPMKDYLCYVVTTLRYWTGFTNCDMSYTLPCSGCNRCRTAPTKVQWSWWSIFIRPKYNESAKDYTNVHNELCGKIYESNNEVFAQMDLQANMKVVRDNVEDADEPKFIEVQSVSSDIDKNEFIKKGWSRVKAEKIINNDKDLTLQVNTIKVGFPDKEEDGKKGLVIDNEHFETMKTLSIQLLPNKLRFYYCPKNRVSADVAAI